MGVVVEDLRRVSAGLRMVLMGLALVVVNLVAAVAVVLAFGEPGQDPAAMVAALSRNHTVAFTVLIALNLLSNVLAITGKVFCLSVPTAAGASQFILMAVACSGIGLGLWIVGQVPDLDASAVEFAQTSPLFTMVGFLFFLRFLRRLAAYLGSARLLAKATQVQIATVALIVTYLVAALGSAALLLHAAMVVVALVLAIGAMVVFVLYAILIRDLRRTTEIVAETTEPE